MKLSTLHAALAAATLLCAAAPARADEADVMFKRGKKLLAEKKFAEACAVFEEVDRLDPGIGAKLNVGKCYEEWGRIGTAYRWYRDAEKLAADTNDDRFPKIRALADEIDANVPRMTISVPADADPTVLATLMLDGQLLPAAELGKERVVDPGPHLIEWIVAGQKQKKVIPLERGGSAELTLEIPRGAVTPRGEGDEDDDDEDDRAPARPGRGQRILGLSLAGGGVAAGVVAGVLTLGARGRYKDALAEHCMGSTTMCDDEGLQITGDARSTANLATVITLAGGALIAGGIVLYVLAPDGEARERQALYLTPVVGAEGGGLVFGGRY